LPGGVVAAPFGAPVPQQQHDADDGQRDSSDSHQRTVGEDGDQQRRQTRQGHHHHKSH
jgi:hypothetical protein